MITKDSIARLAYTIWLDRCKRGLPGTDVGDWLEAERRLYKMEEQNKIDFRFHYLPDGDDFSGRVDVDQ